MLKFRILYSISELKKIKIKIKKNRVKFDRNSRLERSDKLGKLFINRQIENVLTIFFFLLGSLHAPTYLGRKSRHPAGRTVYESPPPHHRKKGSEPTAMTFH